MENSNDKVHHISIVWNEDDVKQTAQNRWKHFQSEYFKKRKHPWYGISKWEDLYDKEKFAEVLDDMEDNHDANYGITWQTIEDALDRIAVKEKYASS